MVHVMITKFFTVALMKMLMFSSSAYSFKGFRKPLVQTKMVSEIASTRLPVIENFCRFFLQSFQQLQKPIIMGISPLSESIL
jgi:hypothetical protein